MKRGGDREVLSTSEPSGAGMINTACEIYSASFARGRATHPALYLHGPTTEISLHLMRVTYYDFDIRPYSSLQVFFLL